MNLKDVENQIRELVNWAAVKKQEEVQDVTTRIEPQTAEELTAKLSALAVVVAKLELERHKRKAQKPKKKAKAGKAKKKKRI